VMCGPWEEFRIDLQSVSLPYLRKFSKKLH
jgi:hypothetical protein